MNFDSITITVSLPSPKVSQNARCHWRVKAEATKEQRSEAMNACVELLFGRKQWRRATVKIRAFFKTKRHPDPMNFIGSLKAAFDGIQDAGIIQDDSQLWPLRPEFFTDSKNPRVELTITEEP
jgi:crossover junction endodeoxyribonuclease RusA